MEFCYVVEVVKYNRRVYDGITVHLRAPANTNALESRDRNVSRLERPVIRGRPVVLLPIHELPLGGPT
jgi:hypothetical protein